MSVLRVLVVDDEPLIRAGIRAELSSMPDVHVAGECGSVEEAVQSIRAGGLDLVLLDVQMPDGTGFDVIRRVGLKQMPAVVFVTAYDQYAIQAFEVNAVDYLLKPFDDARLKQSVERARERLQRPAELLRRMEALLQSQQTPRPQRLVVHDGERYQFVPVEAIDWIESANNYAILHCGPVSHVYGDNLAALERLLDPRQFLRVHRRHIVNVSRVIAADPLPGGAFELELACGARVSTGRQYAEKVRQLIRG
jgi:two-component system LytT family response regulator